VKPVYKIEHLVSRKKDYYEIVRPDKSIVNETRHSSLADATKHLNTLIAMGYCKGE